MARPKRCWCGCGESVNNRFRQGHDAKFMSLVKKVARGELRVAATIKPMPQAAKAKFREEVATLSE